METPTPKHILIVEDDLSLGAMLLTSLQQRGFEVAAVTGAHAAMTSLETDPIDLVILDILLPKINGLDFLAEMRKRGHTQAVIVVSNMGDIEIQRRAMELGAAQYMVKASTTPNQIIDYAVKLLREPHPQAEVPNEI